MSVDSKCLPDILDDNYYNKLLEVQIAIENGKALIHKSLQKKQQEYFEMLNQKAKVTNENHATIAEYKQLSQELKFQQEKLSEEQHQIEQIHDQINKQSLVSAQLLDSIDNNMQLQDKLQQLQNQLKSSQTCYNSICEKTVIQQQIVSLLQRITGVFIEFNSKTQQLEINLEGQANNRIVIGYNQETYTMELISIANMEKQENIKKEFAKDNNLFKLIRNLIIC